MDIRPLSAAQRREFERFKGHNPGWPDIISVQSEENVIKITFSPPHDPAFIVMSSGGRGYLARGPEVIDRHEGRSAATRLRSRVD